MLTISNILFWLHAIKVKQQMPCYQKSCRKNYLLLSWELQDHSPQCCVGQSCFTLSLAHRDLMYLHPSSTAVPQPHHHGGMAQLFCFLSAGLKSLIGKIIAIIITNKKDSLFLQRTESVFHRVSTTGWYRCSFCGANAFYHIDGIELIFKASHEESWLIKQHHPCPFHFIPASRNARTVKRLTILSLINTCL